MLINCVAYHDGQKLAGIPAEEISDYILRPDCFVRVALREAEPAELSVMQEESGLHELIEERIFIHGSQRDNIERLHALKRKVMTLRHAVAPLLDAAGKLHGGRVPALCHDTQEYFRDVHDHLQRINGTIDAIRDTISTAIQVNLSMVAIDESEVNKRLAAWAAIFAICTAFAGVWGMNFKFMPELEWQYGCPAAVSAMVSVCCHLFYRFKRSGWL